MFEVCKRIGFCYGHRLLGHTGKCRHLHGHNAIVEIVISSEKVDSLGMVRDFADIDDTMKVWIDEHLDHRTILHQDDPLVDWLKNNKEPVYIMDSNPTAEHMAKIIGEQAKKLGLDISLIRLWETPTSYATWKMST